MLVSGRGSKKVLFKMGKYLDLGYSVQTLLSMVQSFRTKCFPPSKPRGIPQSLSSSPFCWDI